MNVFNAFLVLANLAYQRGGRRGEEAASDSEPSSLATSHQLECRDRFFVGLFPFVVILGRTFCWWQGHQFLASYSGNTFSFKEMS